ncbi:MAG: thioredoxin family protein [Desulfobacteraceae bacterium]|nr:thioredoxin family protein [Desulfobacteraceae bacterium]
MKNLMCTMFSLALLLICTGSAGAAAATGEVVPGIPVKGTVTLVDLGATTCIPCRMMAPILEELKKEYQGRVGVVFIDVWDPANEGKAAAFKVMAIPTQVFYDRNGREAYRHTGFLDKKAIAAKLDELLGQK